MKSKVTIQEIADAAGVSKFAVSRALSGKPGVSAQTREMIVKLAGQLGYFKSEAVRSGGEIRDENVQSWSGTVLILFPNIRFQNRESLYWGPIFEGISSRLNMKGIDILTLTEPSSDSLFTLLNPEAIQGIVTVGTVSTTILMEIHRLAIPVVMVDHQDQAFHCDTVFSDNWTVMGEIVSSMAAKGYRSFQFVGNRDDAYSFYERWNAYRAALERLQIPAGQNVKLFGPTGEQMEEAILQMTEEELPEVFVCANDTTAKITVEALARRGIYVPDRCTVTGFDDTHQELPLAATARVNKEMLGIRAVDQLLWRILNPGSPVEKKLIYADLLLREAYASEPAATKILPGI
ncbi:LacI family DNA-binding transcriptional regulator [Paenibacillus sp. JX-17]|uniref:LacI family DNA-binding transcriptional regulator n=1 Tax=Paenibacillus lacisoli TaxID=3064525 RepID=A0ABT9CBB4_9BACL|nr:LacI family DNA-binding transcriptional regulator [Paenibacillus sp. JX-17]MDO7905949.1 LacI family DNA-binding transcriptional regulator [Paenibacillus sp. JX-17]